MGEGQRKQTDGKRDEVVRDLRELGFEGDAPEALGDRDESHHRVAEGETEGADRERRAETEGADDPTRRR